MGNKFKILTQENKYNFIYWISNYLLNADYVLSSEFQRENTVPENFGGWDLQSSSWSRLGN